LSGRHVFFTQHVIERRVRLDPDAIVMVLGVPSRSETSRSKAQEHRSNKFPERGGVYCFKTSAGTMLEVVVIEQATRKTRPFCCLIVVNQPLYCLGCSTIDCRGVGVSGEAMHVRVQEGGAGRRHLLQWLLVRRRDKKRRNWAR
jgi:hypothetical protein